MSESHKGHRYSPETEIKKGQHLSRSTEFKKGNKINLKTGRTAHNYGYISAYKPDHPFASRNRVLEHRLIMEKHIKRYLLPEERVHHINGDKADNRIENLNLFSSESKHQIYHSKSRKPNESPCKIINCNKIYFCKGYCRKHYCKQYHKQYYLKHKNIKSGRTPIPDA